MKKRKCFLILMLVLVVAAFGITCYCNDNSKKKAVEATLI